MVPAIAALLGILLFGACTARADLDLTPSEATGTLEKVKYRSIVFHDDGKVITYTAPRGWTCTGSHNSAAFSIPDHPQARAYIQSAPRLRVPPFDDKTAKLIQDNPALLQLPKGAKQIKINSVDINPFIIDSHPIVEIQATYAFFGQQCARSIIIADRKGAEVSFVLDCLGPDFKVLYPKFRASLFTIENL